MDITVFDTQGRFVADATTSVGATTATTDAKGHAILTIPTGAEQVVAVSKADFADQYKVVNLAADATTGTLRAMLIPREPAQPIDSIEAGGSATGRDGVKVTFPAGALVTASGQAVTGTIQMFMTPVDVAKVDIGAFPGLFEGVAPGTARQPIVSFGTAELVPMQDGAKLALASAASADIELPIYVRAYQDGTPIEVGDAIPLWSLDPSTGVWQQEGEGSVAASSASPTGLEMRATIHHFSWWNSDAFADRGIVTLNVLALGEDLPANTLVDVTGTVIGGGPGAVQTTQAAVNVPTELVVPGGTTTRLEATVQVAEKTCVGSVDVNPPKNGTMQANINLACVEVPTPRLVEPEAPTSTNSKSDLPFQIVVEGKTPDSVDLLVDGAAVASFPAQFFYRGFWDSSAFAEGQHTLQPRATLSGISRTGDPVTVIVDRTAPQVTGIAPAADQDVDQDTVFTIDFDEPVTAAPFALSDVVRLSVLPVGQTTPVEVAFTPALDSAQTTLTVRADEPFPLGVASVSWAGLQDATGNAVSGTIAASWSVSRSARLGPDLALQQSTNFTPITSSSGDAYALRLTPDTHDLQALRFDGVEFVPLGPVINDRPMVTNSGGAGADNATIAVAADGTVFVAFEQLDAAGTSIEVPVRSFDSVSNSWQPLGAAFPVNHAPASNFGARPRLAVDGANRPVLVFISGTLNVIQTQRFEGGAWTPLGAIDNSVYGTTAGGCTLGSGGLVVSESVTVNSEDHPVVAMICKDVFGGTVVAVEHNGTAWVRMSDAVIDRAAGFTGMPILQYTPDGTAWLAWVFGGSQVKLAAFDGTVFVPVVFDPAIQTYNSQVALTVLNGDLVVAGAHEFHGGKADLRRLHDGVWEPQALIPVAGDTRSLSLMPSGNDVLLGQTGADDVGRVTRVSFP
ncbi:MAG TPA: Ig-like domain-containing protein [Steroidobacteraceae bacterium]|nr:Ig-like domain-containing protein [Steroidobacteraceae bacterium]